jgi:septum site-determining protein MinC
MSIDTSVSKTQKTAIDLKSSSFNVPALVLASAKLSDIRQELQLKISQAPDFFKYSPLLIDLHELSKQPAEIDLHGLIKLLRELRFIPIAVSGGNAKQNETAIELGLAIQSVHSLTNAVTQVRAKIPFAQPQVAEVEPDPEPVVEAVVTESGNKLITQPIRSGQRVYAKGDLTILAPVNPGAEIIAEGNIHVYAPLRGRALAGVKGDTGCYIFCSDLQAELISIAGIYCLHDDLDKSFQHHLVQIYLENESLLIKKL